MIRLGDDYFICCNSMASLPPERAKRARQLPAQRGCQGLVNEDDLGRVDIHLAE